MTLAKEIFDTWMTDLRKRQARSHGERLEQNFSMRQAELAAECSDSPLADLQATLKLESEYRRGAVAEATRLRTAVVDACALLAERTQGSPARSPGHNARLLLETAIGVGQGTVKSP